MLEKLDIVLLSYADWRAAKTTPHHLARILAERNRVLFVDVPHSFLRFLKGRDPLGAAQWSGPRVQSVSPGLWVQHPRHAFLPTGGLPHALSRRALAINGRLLARQVRHAMRNLEFAQPILWSTSPLHAGAVPHVPHSMLVHDICEEWVNFLDKPDDRRLLTEVDCDLTHRADIAFAFSEPMARRRAGLNPHMHVVYPAGDVEFFSCAANPETVVPPEIATLPRPLIGAMCVVDRERFDVDLVALLAARHPDWSFVVLGPVRRDVVLAPLTAHRNVQFLNPPRAVLPACLKGFDVALVPYRLNDATRDIYPMKIQEYLAAGKPVVSPYLHVCRHLNDVVYFSGSHEEYDTNVVRALAEDSPGRVARRRAVAQQNSWRERVDERAKHVAARRALYNNTTVTAASTKGA